LSTVEKTSNNTIKNSFRGVIARLAIRFGILKRKAMHIEQINQLVNNKLPFDFEIPTPGGHSILSFLEISVTVDDSRNCLLAELLCNFQVDVKKKIIYNTHLQINVELGLRFFKETQSIGAEEVSVTEINLISDKYSVMKDTSSLLSGLVPNAVRSLVNLTLTSTSAILNSKRLSNAAQYLLLYSSGSKQMVIDYHKPTIENKVRQILDSPDNRYQLDATDFEEQLFAQLGKKVTIENGKIYFVFSD